MMRSTMPVGCMQDVCCRYPPCILGHKCSRSQWHLRAVWRGGQRRGGSAGVAAKAKGPKVHTEGRIGECGVYRLMLQRRYRCRGCAPGAWERVPSAPGMRRRVPHG